MQLFVTSPHPVACAQTLDDRRVNNQIRETAQLLCTSLQMHGVHFDGIMRPTHEGHPVTKWVASSSENLFWTYRHFRALAMEKLVRWPANCQHKNWLKLKELLLEYGSAYLDRSAQTPFVNCCRRDDLDIDFTHVPDVHLAYEQYLCARWSLEQPRWSNRQEPVFYDFLVS